MKIKKVMIPTDFSELSNKTNKAAISMAKQLGADVVFVHVLARLDHPDEMTALFDEGYAYMKDQANALLNDLAILARQSGIEASAELGIGVPHIEIVRLSKALKVDLIMMGTHGRTGFDHFLMGSQAERVVQLSSCPVTVFQKQSPHSRQPQLNRRVK